MAILKPDVCIISDRHIFAPRRSTNIASPLSEPYKFLLHILKNNSAAKNCTDVRLGQVVNLSIFDSIISEILGLRHSTVLRNLLYLRKNVIIFRTLLHLVAFITFGHSTSAACNKSQAYTCI